MKIKTFIFNQINSLIIEFLLNLKLQLNLILFCNLEYSLFLFLERFLHAGIFKLSEMKGMKNL